jgi:hypothetical protein
VHTSSNLISSSCCYHPLGNDESKLKNDSEQNAAGIVPNVLFISRFRRDTTVRDIEELMKPYGATADITIRDTIAFVDFLNAEDAAKAKHACHYSPGLGSDSLIVDFKKDPRDRPPFSGRVGYFFSLI